MHHERLKWEAMNLSTAITVPAIIFTVYWTSQFTSLQKIANSSHIFPFPGAAFSEC